MQLTAPGLVVFSELDYPAWKVQVDGVSRPVVRVNGGLRAVVVPAGEHTVVWRYDSDPSNVGISSRRLRCSARQSRWSHHTRSPGSELAVVVRGMGRTRRLGRSRAAGLNTIVVW
ncbi:MAG: hypothetical protein WKH64_07120 [Chloroflexia bacterium]